jgi:hypothetical protein
MNDLLFTHKRTFQPPFTVFLYKVYRFASKRTRIPNITALRTPQNRPDAFILQIIFSEPSPPLLYWRAQQIRPHGLRRGSSAFRLQGLRVWIPPLGMGVCCERCVSSGRGLCDELITRPEESYRLWCVWAYLWSPDIEETLDHLELSRHGGSRNEGTPLVQYLHRLEIYPQCSSLCAMRVSFILRWGRSLLCREPPHLSAGDQLDIQTWKRTTLVQVYYTRTFYVLETEIHLPTISGGGVNS